MGRRISGYRYIGNKNTTEVHDLDKENTNCQINEIKEKVGFTSLQQAYQLGYQNCKWCLGNSPD